MDGKKKEENREGFDLTSVKLWGYELRKAK